MEELLFAMMNEGFVIYVDHVNNKIILQKFSTPASPMMLYFENDKTYFECQSREEALELAQKMMTWKSAPTPPPPEPNWSASLMYKHRGERIPRFAEIGMIENKSYEEANQIASSMGSVWINTYFNETEIEKWEVKIRPVQ